MKSEDKRAERTPMKWHWLLLSLTVVLCPPLLAAEPAPAAPLTLTEIVVRLQTRYQETQGFQADFVQEVESATLGYRLTSEGQVFFKKPGRMRWDFRPAGAAAGLGRDVFVVVSGGRETSRQDSV